MASVTFPIELGGDGSTVTDDRNPLTGLRGGGYRDRLVPMFSQAVTVLQTGIDRVATEGAEQVALVAAEGAEQLAAVTAEGVEQLGLVAAEGAAQVANVTAEGLFRVSQLNGYVVQAELAAQTAVGAANYQGDYSAVITYLTGQSVSYLGQRFIAKKSNLGITPVDGPDWLLLDLNISGVPDGVYLRKLVVQTVGTTLFPVPTETTKIRAYLVGRGGTSGTAVSGSAGGGGGGGFGFGDITVAPGENISLTISAGGVATLVRGGVTLITANAGNNGSGGSGGGGGTAAITAAVTNGGAFSGASGGGASSNNGNPSRGGGGSSGSPLGNGTGGGSADVAGGAGAYASGGSITQSGQGVTSTGGAAFGNGRSALPSNLTTGYTDPLLSHLLGPNGFATSENGGPGGLGSAGNTTVQAGVAGFGASSGASVIAGGRSGELAGSSNSAQSRAGGGGSGSNSPGGPATIWIFY